MNSKPKFPDIKPSTPISRLVPPTVISDLLEYPIGKVAQMVGMAPVFIGKYLGHKSRELSKRDVVNLLEADAFSETFVPRSKVLAYLDSQIAISQKYKDISADLNLHRAAMPGASNLLRPESVNCVVTSTPYWGTRIYEESVCVTWADGETCPFGHEQTPEGFIRHSIEILVGLSDVLAADGSIWWNVMDTFNTRTQIRSNAAEALRAMQGKDSRSWADHECRRYSAGHSFLKDGEQCSIPQRIGERASRIGLYLKSSITWAKTSTLPEPQLSRVSRNIETILHLTKCRTPKFFKDAYLENHESIGGRSATEVGKVSDVWILPTSSGRDGHGAQFPLALPGRCILLTTETSDVVLDPFVGSGTSGVAARRLGRRFVGFDVSEKYLKVARKKIEKEIEGRLPGV